MISNVVAYTFLSRFLFTMTRKLFIISLFSLVFFCSCGDDDNTDSSSAIPQVTNFNKNSEKNENYLRLEFPKIKDDNNNLIVVHSTQQYGVNYSIEWDCKKRAQRWTCYAMYAKNSVVNWSRGRWNNTEWNGDPFQEDPDIPASYNVTLYDHVGDGFDRGHICPSQDRLCSREANEQTFYLSNMHPQYNAFNTGVWEKMEQKVRSWNTNQFRDTLYICKGGTIDKNEQVLMISNKGLIVPKYFFMAVLCKNSQGYKAIGFLVEHTNTTYNNQPLSNYVVSIDQLEQFTGIDFFCNLPDEIENKVEKNVTNVIWGL